MKGAFVENNSKLIRYVHPQFRALWKWKTGRSLTLCIFLPTDEGNDLP